jgi:thiamine transport system substrate-binding protein
VESGGSVKHFIIYIGLIIAGLFAAFFLRSRSGGVQDSRPIVRIYAPTSFMSQWGPGPWLKEKFELNCACQVEFLDSANVSLLLQRLKMEGSNLGADLVLGLDQFDLDKAQAGFEWRALDFEHLDFEEDVQRIVNKKLFWGYDWGILSFVVRRSEMKQLPQSFDDLMREEFKGKISLEDPRTSTPGLQFLLWLIQIKGEEETFQFLKKFDSQVMAYSPSWSTAYGLFQKGQAKAAFSYVTSPIYHLVEEKSNDVVAVELKEDLPVQVEFLGQPVNCRNCDLGEAFARLILSPEGQKVVMEKNYMFPVIKKVKEGTPFESVPKYKTLDSNVIPPMAERERILKRWSELRRGQ